MRATPKLPFPMRKIAMAVALASLGSNAYATLVADGKLGEADPSSPHGTAAAALAEGYTTGWQIGFVDQNGKSMGNGQVWFGTDKVTGDQFLYVLLPTGFVDNTYGANISPAWSKANGGPGKHTFSDLLGSDSEGQGPAFQWTDQNDASHNTFATANSARVDYIADCSADAAVCDTNPSNATADYRSAGVGSKGTGVVDGTNGAGSNWKNIDASLTGSASSIKEIATSLEYDLQNIDPTATTDSSLSPNWVKEVGYEYEFAPGTFDANTWNNPTMTLQNINNTPTPVVPGVLSLGDFHVSPPTKQFGSFTPPCLIGSPTCGQVPEPGSVALIASGLAAMAWYTRRRRTDAVPKPPERIVAA
jgi:hypothetical protein